MSHTQTNNTTEAKERINDYTGRDYRTVWQHPRSEFEDKFEGKVIQKLLTKDKGWFIDLGAGYGRLYPLSKREGRKIVLADYAINLLEMAEKELPYDDVYFVAVNAYHLPFKEGVFSGGISNRVMHHMNLPDAFFNELGRTISGGGRFLMEYANKRNLFRILRRGGTAFEHDHEEYEPLHFGTHPAYFTKLANDAGFTVGKTLGSGLLPKFIVKKTVFLIPIFNVLETIFNATLGRLGLCPLHFADIKKEDGKASENYERIEDILQCPACAGGLEMSNDTEVQCVSCQRTYKKVGKIFDLRYTPDE